jgi:hypothetical protein
MLQLTPASFDDHPDSENDLRADSEHISAYSSS